MNKNILNISCIICFDALLLIQQFSNTMANDFKLMDSNSPTQQRNIEPKIRRVVFDYEICDKTGYPYPCSIHYEIDERTKEVFDHGATFHYGSGGGYEHVLESLHLIIEDLEGSVEYVGEPIIE